MQQPRKLDATPAARVQELVDLLGRDEVVAWCADLLAGRAAHDDPDLPPLTWLGGPSTAWLLSLDADQLQVNAYWVRVWGARGLLHCYEPSAARDVTEVARRHREQRRLKKRGAAPIGGNRCRLGSALIGGNQTHHRSNFRSDFDKHTWESQMRKSSRSP